MAKKTARLRAARYGTRGWYLRELVKPEGSDSSISRSMALNYIY